MAVNDPARDFLRKGDGLRDRGGFLHARSPDDDDRLQKLLARALPRGGERGTSASMLVNRRSVTPRLVLHVSPVSGGRMGFRPRHVAALVLVVDPARRARIDPELVMVALDLTRAESQVAAMLAEGRTPRDIAAATGCRESTIRWHIQRDFRQARHLSAGGAGAAGVAARRRSTVRAFGPLTVLHGLRLHRSS